MNIDIMIKILQAKKIKGVPFELSVIGSSMEPELYEDDTVIINPQNEYKIGDILIFVYQQRELLIHRLMKVQNDIYYCKGDNCYRFEDMTANDIIGKATHKIRNDETIQIQNCSDKLIYLSIEVNKVYTKYNLDLQKTQESEIYKLYKKIILSKREDIQVYIKNTDMEFIEVDEKTLVVFDSESGDTHYIDEVGIDIVNVLNDPCDIDMLVERLTAIYDTEPDVIRTDVIDFLNDLISKKIVKIL